MDTKNNKNGKAVQGAETATLEPQKTAISETAVNGNGKLQEHANGKEAPKPTETAPVLSVEDKIRKVFTLNDLIEKRGLLKRHEERVASIKFGEYEEKDILTISGSAGQPYAIKSTSVCKKIAGLLKEEITQNINEVEAEINGML
jgi:hypothetical protein